jgi:GH43 family beta-xylosidase
MRYENPVWPHYFADPFVIRIKGEYYAYGTGPVAMEPDGRALPILRSDNLVDWKYVGGAIQPEANSTAHWAPEVAEEGGRFYMYYSSATGGGDESHRIRVAIAEDPAGPFIPTGNELMPDEGFTIDPHPFRDPRTGQWYLFFGTDYLKDEPFGTGVAVVRMKDMLTVETPPVLVNRASQDWQIYERNRNYKGRTWPAWYTVEGPCVLFHEDRYYCLYSGGRWSGEGYGVGFAVADRLLGPWKDDFAVNGPTVLKGIPGQVIGPGHCSVTQGPDGHAQMLVYHAWNREMTMRRMCIDPLHWTPQGSPRCDGPSTGPRANFIEPWHASPIA